MTRLLFIPGSLRRASSSRALAEALAKRVGDRAEVRFADPGALPHYNADLGEVAEVEALKEAIRSADGVVFFSPEYNYGMPGVLKNAIDWASRPAYESVFVGKPCLVATVSGAATGGVRAQGQLKYTLHGMLAEVFASKEIVVPSANAKVTDGVFDDAATLDFAGAILDDFVDALGGEPAGDGPPV